MLQVNSISYAYTYMISIELVVLFNIHYSFRNKIVIWKHGKICHQQGNMAFYMMVFSIKSIEKLNHQVHGDVPK